MIESQVQAAEARTVETRRRRRCMPSLSKQDRPIRKHCHRWFGVRRPPMARRNSSLSLASAQQQQRRSTRARD